ncbi:MAG: AAA family ATPase [Dehalococcoidia bacterium]|nr:AAA family ATPase [Dehalococcoidia bacterium]
MFCAHCGTGNASGVENCDRCGEPLIVPDMDQRQPSGVKTCPGCSTLNESHARFCIGCRNGLDAVVAAPPDNETSAYARPGNPTTTATTQNDIRGQSPGSETSAAATLEKHGEESSPTSTGAGKNRESDPLSTRENVVSESSDTPSREIVSPARAPTPSRAGANGPAPIAEFAARVREAVQTVIVGKDEAINLAIVALLCRGHLLIEDVPGLGKTTLAKALAASLRCDFGRIQFTPDLMPADVLGVSVFNMRDNEFEFRRGPIFTQVLLADEINRATPRTQTALLEAMQERQVTMDGETRTLPDPFLVMATLNPVELEGTFPLPEAQLDRFMLRVSLGYPSRAEEADIIERFTAGGAGPETPAVVSREELLTAQDSIAGVTVEPSLRDYLLAIVSATREHESLHLGASPRAAIALYNAAQAWAAIQGRDYVLPDDIKQVAVPVLAHRLMVSPQAGLRGRAGDNVIKELLETTEVPIER